MAPVIKRPDSTGGTAQHIIHNEGIQLGEYLLLRIHQANPKMRSVFGIPGDFNLSLLEHLYSESVVGKVEFVGFCNELNAAYAADGYAKAIESFSVLITTYGVGELSALNGIAGAFAEYAPILHIVGTTSMEQMVQAANADVSSVRNIHHLVQNKNALVAPNHDIYKSIVNNISVIQESLDSNVFDNLEKIDRVLKTILHERRPGYLFIPSDLPDVMVPKERLYEELDLNELTNEKLLTEVSQRILTKLYCSKRPSILGDMLVERFGAQSALNRFVQKLPSNFVKLFTSPLSRNIDESLPNFVGVYSGKSSSGPEVVYAMENETDFLLRLGHSNNEINVGFYSTNYTKIAQYVEVHPDYILIDNEYIHTKNAKTGQRQFSINDLISRLETDFNRANLLHHCPEVNNISPRKVLEQFSLRDTVPPHVLTQNKLTDFFNAYLRPDDILVCETCSFLFGIPDLRFPRGVKFFSQHIYGSIGYAIPATFGISRAERDMGNKRRIILIEGDGSAQMTIQELSTFLRYDIQPPEIFLLNNEGYTIERFINGPTRPYNDIQDQWNWTNIFRTFGDENGDKHVAEKINTTGDLTTLLTRKPTSKIRFSELKLPKMDVPDRFRIWFERN